MRTASRARSRRPESCTAFSNGVAASGPVQWGPLPSRMDRVISTYCERVGAGLWAEPLNAVTSLAFLVAAALGWTAIRRSTRAGAGPYVLVWLVASIGLGSALFHTFATPWAGVVDVLPILLFELTFLWLYLRRRLDLARGPAAALLLSYLLVWGGGRALPHVLDGSLTYAPAALALVAIGGASHRVRGQTGGAEPLAALLFLVAAVLRTIDGAVCPYFPMGTHFLWHLLIPIVLYLLVTRLLEGRGADAVT